MLLRYGSTFGIAYATHIDSIGFRNFSVAHELGHYYLPGHIDAVLSGDVHESHAGFASGSRYEMEADHFAATLLMPRALFKKAMNVAGDGLRAITSVPHFQDHASDNWEPEGAGSDGVVNRSWSGRRSNMLSWSTCSIW